MTERTIIKKSLTMDDDDSVSINSTQESEIDEERSYIVDRILAEQDDDEGNKYYLILWEGYDRIASTWEPAENIEGQATFDDWNDEKMRITRGLSKEFDVVAFENELESLRLAKENRRERRKAKRERLGLAVSLSDFEEEFPISASKKLNINTKETEKPRKVSVEPTMPKVVSKPKSAASKGSRAVEEKPMENNITTRVKRRTINLPSQGCVSDTSEESYSAGHDEEPPDAKTMDKKHGAMTSRQVRDTLGFISDEGSSPSDNNPTSKETQKLLRRNTKRKPASSTGYKGTAKNGPGAISVTSQGQVHPPSRGATRGHHRGRGRGRGRGRREANAQVGKLSFITPNTDPQMPQRKRSLANAILNAPNVDSSKPVEHFKTPSMVRKAELAARSLADRAPDFQSVGFLSRPSDYGSRSRRKRPQVLQEASETGQSSESPLIIGEDVVSTISVKEKEEDDAPLNETEPQFEAEISEHTAKLGLSRTSDRIHETHHESQKIFEEVPISPHLIVEDLSIAAGKLKTSISGEGVATTQPLRLSSTESRTAIELQAAILPGEEMSSRPSKPRTKMNLKEYKSRRKSEFLGDAVTVQALFGNSEGTPMLLGLTDMNETLRSYWGPILERSGVLNFNQSCLAQEFQNQMTFLQSEVRADGNVIVGSDGAMLLEDVAEQLRPCSGLIFIQNVVCILIYPARCEEWKFIDSSSDVDHRLRYQIFEPKFPDGIAGQLNNAFAGKTMSSLNLKRRYLDTLVEVAQNLRYENLLPTHSEGQDVHNFFLFFPTKASTSAKYVASWLRSCKVDCRIYTIQKSGSWDLFTNNPVFKAGVVIFHDSFLPLISKIPRISSLINGNFHISFWSMDDGSHVNLFRSDYARAKILPSCEASMVRLFPHGGAIFLTPSFLIIQPERAYELLKWFQRKVSSSTPCTWKLVLSSKCREYLLDLAVEKTSAYEHQDTNLIQKQDQTYATMVAVNQLGNKQERLARFRSYAIIDQLLKKECMSGFPDYWEETPDEFESSVIYVDDCIGYNDEKGLVSWFAGWTMLHLNFFRKFIVVGTSPSSRRFTDSAKSTHHEFLGESLRSVPALHKSKLPKLPESAATSRKWKRNAFTVLEESSHITNPSPASPSEKTSIKELSARQSVGDFSKSRDLIKNLRSGNSAIIPASADPRHEPAHISTNPRQAWQGAKTKHGIDETQPQSILEFIAITGRDAETAKTYLARYNWDVHTAVQRYARSIKHSSADRFQSMDGTHELEDQSAVVDFIAGTHASAQDAERYLHLAQDDVRRAICLYNDSQQQPRSPSGELSNQGKLKERESTNENGSARRLDKAASHGSVNRGHRQGALQQGDSISSGYIELQGPRKGEIRTHIALSEAEQDKGDKLDNRSRLGSTGTVQAANMMDLDLLTNITSGKETLSLLSNKAGMLSPEANTRTSSGDLVEKSGSFYDPDGGFHRTENLQDQCRTVVPNHSNDAGDALYSSSTAAFITQHEPVLETDLEYNYDGVIERAVLSEKRSPRRTSIDASEGGARQVMSNSKQPSRTTQPEAKSFHQSCRVVEGTPHYEADDMDDSNGGSGRSSTCQSPTTKSKRQSIPYADTPAGTTGENVLLNSDFETTTEWYGKLARNGQGWEHIYVGGWESCFQKLLIKN